MHTAQYAALLRPTRADLPVTSRLIWLMPVNTTEVRIRAVHMFRYLGKQKLSQLVWSLD